MRDPASANSTVYFAAPTLPRRSNDKTWRQILLRVPHSVVHLSCHAARYLDLEETRPQYGHSQKCL